jgi:hypothetical protein
VVRGLFAGRLPIQQSPPNHTEEVTRATHLEDALASLELGPEEGARLEGPYVPHTVVGPE